MPTSLKRIQVTQTPSVARALEAAAKEWPGTPRAELIARLMECGAEAATLATFDARLAEAASARGLDVVGTSA